MTQKNPSLLERVHTESAVRYRYVAARWEFLLALVEYAKFADKSPSEEMEALNAIAAETFATLGLA